MNKATITTGNKQHFLSLGQDYIKDGWRMVFELSDCSKMYRKGDEEITISLVK